ncbi:MAG: hypothetical protein WCE81_08995 [Halobacteriota archaeon]
MTVDTNTIQFLQDLCQTAIGVVHHPRLVRAGLTFILMLLFSQI